ncbi:hypothetical protein AB0M92_12445 [Streptomyces sp. NPDC051582]|uniref:hypothetical protein n=1 Tax=Streptomyces sp. NPDC051582 TaxID=3155167 RepID=UPI0034269CAE
MRPLFDLTATEAAANEPGRTFRRRIELVLALDVWLRHYGTEPAFRDRTGPGSAGRVRGGSGGARPRLHKW